jgi:hypothetical protein
MSKLNYLMALFLLIIFIAIIGPFSVQVKVKSQNPSDPLTKANKIKDTSLYLIKGMEKYIPESIWPDNEFPIKIYIAKKGTNLVGTYKLKEVKYISSKKEKVGSKE